MDSIASTRGSLSVHLPQHDQSGRSVEASSKTDLSSSLSGNALEEGGIPVKSALRVRVINEASQRFKDLVVNIQSDLTLFDAIYDNKAVKAAHVRKWGPEVVKKVKQKNAEICCSLWDEEFERPSRMFSVHELKQTSTCQLYEMDTEAEILIMVLQCVDNDSVKKIDSSLETNGHGETQAAKPAMMARIRDQLSLGSSPHESIGIDQSIKTSESSYLFGKDESRFASPRKSLIPTKEETTKRGSSNALDETEESKQEYIPQLSTVTFDGDGDEQFKDGQSQQISVLSFMRSTGLPSDEISRAQGTTTSISLDHSSEDHLSSVFSQERKKTSLRIRISNKVTNRSKDLMVNIDENINLFEAVYDNKLVKEAHVRKWGSKIAKDVKENRSEIKVVVWDDRSSTAWHTFTLNELKYSSTRDLYEIIPESCDLVKLVLDCVPTMEIDPPKLTQSPTQKAEPDTTSSLRHVKSENQLRSAVKSKKPKSTRLNHMSFFSHQEAPSTASVSDSSKALNSMPGNYSATASQGQPSSDVVSSYSNDLVDRLGPGGKNRRRRRGQRPRARSDQIGTLIMKSKANNLHSTSSVSSGSQNEKLDEAKHDSKESQQQNGVRSIKEDFISLQQKLKSTGPSAEMSRRSLAPPSVQLELDKKTLTTSEEKSGLLDTEEGQQEKEKSEQSTGNVAKDDLVSTKSQNSKMGRRSSDITYNRTNEKVERFLAGMSTNEALEGARANVMKQRRSSDFLLEEDNQRLKEFRRLLNSKKSTENQSDSDLSSIKKKKVSSSSTTTPSDSAMPLPSKNAVFPSSIHTLSLKENPLLSRVSSLTLQDKASSSGVPGHGGAPNAMFSPGMNEKRDLWSPSTQKQKKAFDRIERLVQKQVSPDLEGSSSISISDTSSERKNNIIDLSFKQKVGSVIDVPHTNPLTNRVSSLTLQDKRSSNDLQARHGGAPNETFAASITPTTPGQKKKPPKVSDRISRFLRKKMPLDVVHQPDVENSRSNTVASDELHISSRETNRTGHANAIAPSSKQLTLSSKDIPPIAEISIGPGSSSDGIGLSPELVKEVFPYHVVLNEDFRILQVGKSLRLLFEDDLIIGRSVSEILMVTSPIPMYGKWDWSVIQKMKDKTIFLESVLSDTSETKAKIKGTIIEISKSPMKVMLVLFPNVKNLAELEMMGLSMSDLPLHSCQREAVLLGEHSKSEVKLTNHLDQLHRDLINSMERQIEDRTNELAMANCDLARANSQLAIQSARQLEHFACMSHEIRTPLNCIVGMSCLLLDDARMMDPMHSESIKMINTSGDLLKAVVDDVLDYAKLESGSFEVDIKPTKLQDALASVVHSISKKVAERNIRLRIHFSPDLPSTLETDSRRLQQVLFNLLGNAGKFSKPNSVIDLSVKILETPTSLRTENQFLSSHIFHFSVKDYGKGIDKKDFKTIFEPFSQASKETQNIYGGTGLGLSITSKLVRRLGGTVSLDSEPEKFTEFTFDLPFTGELVDIELMKRKFSTTQIVVVDTEEKFDYSFTTYPILPEPVPFGHQVAGLYGLDVVRFQSLKDARIHVTKENWTAPNRDFAILVKEDLYDAHEADLLESTVEKGTLMTFGPNYSVESTRNRHFQSLVNVFPSTLMDMLLDRMVKERRSRSLSIGSSGAQQFSGTSSSSNQVGMFASLKTSASTNPSDLLSSPLPFLSNPPGKGGLFSELRSQPAPSPVTLGRALSIGSRERARSSEGRERRSDELNVSLHGDRRRLRKSDKSPIRRPGGLFASLQSPDAEASGSSTKRQQSPPKTKESSTLQSASVKSSSSSDKKAQKAKEAMNEAKDSKRQNLKVLYAEDNLVNQKVLSRVLNRAGIRDITIVDNGKKAVDSTEKIQYDCIFMDMQMPVMGGMEACRLIVERDPQAVVIFVTAHALDEFKAHAVAIGATSFISKPFRLPDIEEVLVSLNL